MITVFTDRNSYTTFQLVQRSTSLVDVDGKMKVFGSQAFT